MPVDEHLEMALPVAEILNLVQEQHPGHAIASARRAKLLGELLDRQACVERLVERDIGDVAGLVPAVAEQPRDDVMQQHRLAHAPRTHEDHRAADVGLLRETPEALEVRTPLHGLVVASDAAAVPPRVVGAHPAADLLLGNPAHAPRLAGRC